MTIADRIRAAREATGRTQEDVARASGLTLKAYGQIERGAIQDPHISSLTKIGRALDVPISELLDR